MSKDATKDAGIITDEYLKSKLDKVGSIGDAATRFTLASLVFGFAAAIYVTDIVSAVMILLLQMFIWILWIIIWTTIGYRIHKNKQNKENQGE